MGKLANRNAENGLRIFLVMFLIFVQLLLTIASFYSGIFAALLAVLMLVLIIRFLKIGFYRFNFNDEGLTVKYVFFNRSKKILFEDIEYVKVNKFTPLKGPNHSYLIYTKKFKTRIDLDSTELYQEILELLKEKNVAIRWSGRV